MKNKIIAILSAALLCFGGMCGITAHANYDSTAAAPAATGNAEAGAYPYQQRARGTL